MTDPDLKRIIDAEHKKNTESLPPELQILLKKIVEDCSPIMWDYEMIKKLLGVEYADEFMVQVVKGLLVSSTDNIDGAITQCTKILKQLQAEDKRITKSKI